ncbi:MAG TPA: SRPBCC domain-containing protein [Terriglobales bacterium]|jgi:uncharacterized protein YndB with AHSA1/START domain|nr:SRPBCC domain-containing protein [Terriglobales bacterium]
MATATVTPAQDAVYAEIFIAAPPERVFEALTDPQQMPQWWGQQGLYRITEWKGDVRPGGKWSSVGVGADGTSFRVDGEYLEVDPPRLLVHTWIPSYRRPLMKTVVRWELEPHSVHGLHHAGPRKMGTGTMVRLRHEGFAGAPQSAVDHAHGWERVLGWMQAFVENGDTADTREPVSKG